jgi:hypothetical protein
MTNFAEKMRDEHEARQERETEDVTTTQRIKFAAREYKKTATIFAVPLGFPFKVQSKEGDLLGKAGDYLAIAPDDTEEKPHRWIISKEDFEKTYEQV